GGGGAGPVGRGSAELGDVRGAGGGSGRGDGRGDVASGERPTGPSVGRERRLQLPGRGVELVHDPRRYDQGRGGGHGAEAAPHPWPSDTVSRPTAAGVGLSQRGR